MPLRIKKKVGVIMVNEESMSMGKRFLGVLVSPGKTFKAIGEDPRILIPGIIFIVISALLTALIIPETQELTKMLMQKNPQMTPDMIEKSVKWAGIGAVFSAIFGIPIIWLIQAGLLALYNQLSIGQATFKQLFAVAIFSSIPSLINSVLVVGLTKVMGAKSMLSIKTSLALLLPPGQDSGFLYNFLNAANLFTIWVLVLISIGGGVMMNKDAKKVGIYIFALWLAFILISSIFATKFGTGAPTL